MARINDNYLKLKSSYLFTDIAARIKAFQAEHPDARIIRLGHRRRHAAAATGRRQALHAAVDEMARAETFRGYGPEPGYEFLHRADRRARLRGPRRARSLPTRSS